MTLNDLTRGESWMDPEERQCAAKLVQSLQRSFADRQIPETPFLILRVQDCLVHHALCRRLERSLTPNPVEAVPAAVDPKLAEQIGKSRDRLRRVLKELEDAAAKAAALPAPAAPAPVLNADFYKDLIEEVGIDLNDPEFFADAMDEDDDTGLGSPPPCPVPQPPRNPQPPKPSTKPKPYPSHPYRPFHQPHQSHQSHSPHNSRHPSP